MNDEELLEQHGWLMECSSPLEICFEETGDRATGIAAEIIIDLLRDLERKKKRKKKDV